MSNFIDIDLIDPDSYVFSFGVYKGVDYSDVKHDNPGYIIWCADNIDWFKIDEDELEELKELVSDEERDAYDTEHDYWLADEYDYVD